MNPWKAPTEIVTLLDEVRELHHTSRLANASIAVCMDDSKPFVHNRINLGKVHKFSPLAKLWQIDRHDFCLLISMDLWEQVLTVEQKPAYLDLQLSRCGVEYIPEFVEVNGKKKPIKDEWGRIQYTNEIKVDDEGNPKWKVLPLDIEVITHNMSRYGLWCEDYLELKKAIGKHEVECDS